MNLFIYKLIEFDTYMKEFDSTSLLIVLVSTYVYQLEIEKPNVIQSDIDVPNLQ